MATIITKHFDVLDYVKKAKEYGVSEEFAEYNARQIEQAIDIAVTTMREDVQLKELATKGDVRESELCLLKEIEIIRSEIKSLEVKLMTIYGGGFLILLGVLAKGFNWF